MRMASIAAFNTPRSQCDIREIREQVTGCGGPFRFDTERRTGCD